MKKLLISALMVAMTLGAFAQKSKNSFQANVLYGSKIETVGFGLTFNLTGKKHEFSPSINVYLPKDDVKVHEINFDYHRLYGIGNKIKVFPIIGFAIASWDGDTDSIEEGMGTGLVNDNGTKLGANLGIGGRYAINDSLDAGFQLKYSAMSGSASQTVPMLTAAYKF